MSDKFHPDMVPGPCICGSPSTYDGVEHRVACDKPSCQEYYEDRGASHATVIRHWNQLPALELKLAMQRAEEAEAKLAALRREVVQGKAQSWEPESQAKGGAL